MMLFNIFTKFLMLSRTEIVALRLLLSKFGKKEHVYNYLEVPESCFKTKNKRLLIEK